MKKLFKKIRERLAAWRINLLHLITVSEALEVVNDMLAEQKKILLDDEVLLKAEIDLNRFNYWEPDEVIQRAEPQLIRQFGGECLKYCKYIQTPDKLIAVVSARKKDKSLIKVTNVTAEKP